MKVEINKQAEVKQAVPKFSAGDILILDYKGTTYTTLATNSFDGDKEWVLIELDGEQKWDAPATKSNLIADLQKDLDAGVLEITVVKHKDAVLKLNI